MPLNNPATAGPTHQADVIGLRSLNTIYQNTTGVPLYAAVTVTCQTGNADERAKALLMTDSSNPPSTIVLSMGISKSIALNPANMHGAFMVVLPGNYYRVSLDTSGAGSVALNRWVEWY